MQLECMKLLVKQGQKAMYKKIDELRKEINNINIQMIKFSLLGETILEWNDKDIEQFCDKM